MSDHPTRKKQIGAVLLTIGVIVLVISGLNFVTAEPPPLDPVARVLKRSGVEFPPDDYRRGPKIGLGLGTGLLVLGFLLLRSHV